MDEFIKKAFSKCIKLSAGFALLGSLAACATTSSVNVASNAPITYKVGNQTGAKYASLNSRQTSGRSHGYNQGYTQAQPRRYSPPPAAPRYVAPESARPVLTDSFDMASVDPTLHPHQRVGKKYRYKGKSYTPQHDPSYNVVGTSSWYGDKFQGKPTASGEKFNKNDLTAAHRTLPLNSMLRVTNLETGKSIMVRLNDRGPFVGDRIIDLSESAALELGTYSNGLAMVRVQYAGPASSAYSAPSQPLPIAPPVTQPESMIAEAPSYVAPAPRHTPAAPTYSPLREQADLSALNGDVNVETMPYIPPVDSVPHVPGSAEMSAQAPHEGRAAGQGYLESEAAAAPQYVPEASGLSDYDPDVDGGTVTLTIKGPIHMAKSQKVIGSRSQEPRIIPAKYERVIYNKR